MPPNSLPFQILSAANIDVVYNEIGIDADKVENVIKLVKEWLNCESYLPHHIDDVLLRNFVLGCKGDLEKSKGKLEKYLIAKTQMTYLYHNMTINSEDFIAYPNQRTLYISPKQTPDGCRILIVQLPLTDFTNFDHLKASKFFSLVFDVLLSYDMSAGYHFVYDTKNFSPQYLAKFNLTVLKQISEVMYNIIPFRIRSLLLVNESPSMQLVMSIGKLFMSKKLKDRISAVKAEDLPNNHPKDCLPIEYGGTQPSYNETCDEMLEWLKLNDEWLKRNEGLKATGPVPDHKKNLYSFEEFNMDGSFRQLRID